MIRRTSLTHVVVITLAMAAPVTLLAGPPLICHPFVTGAATLLPWGDGSSWNTPLASYDSRNLARDTMALLTSETPVIVRMENMRRATIYASRNPEAARVLLASVLKRADAKPGETPDPHALFDAGYLLESYEQMGGIRLRMNGATEASYDEVSPASGSRDGYSLVVRAIGLSGGSADMEFAASLMRPGAVGEAHRRRAQKSAEKGSLLARNLAR